MFKNSSLHGLRGLAALLVFAYHVQAGCTTGGFAYPLSATSAAFQTIELGRLGVDLFFMISGYLIVGSLLRHADLRAFFVARLRRIYPAFIVPHLLLFSVGPMVGYDWMRGIGVVDWGLHFTTNLLMLPGVFPLPIAQIVAWSLSYEMAFYVLAMGWYVVADASRSRPLRVALAVGCAVGSAAVLMREPRASFFLAGAACHLLRRTAVVHPTWMGVAGLIGMFAAFNSSLAAAVGCGFVAFLSIVEQRGALATLLRVRPLQYLGDVSYSFYLWHAIVMFPLKRLVVRAAPGPAGVLAFAAVSFAVSITAAHLSYVGIEQGGLARLLTRRRRLPIAASPAARRAA